VENATIGFGGILANIISYVLRNEGEGAKRLGNSPAEQRYCINAHGAKMGMRGGGGVLAKVLPEVTMASGGKLSKPALQPANFRRSCGANLLGHLGHRVSRALAGGRCIDGLRLRDVRTEAQASRKTRDQAHARFAREMASANSRD
jgi:hypothetical protein